MTEGIIQEWFKKVEDNNGYIPEWLKHELIEKIKQKSCFAEITYYETKSVITLEDLIGDNK